MVIIEITVFTRQVQELLSTEECRAMQLLLVEHPSTGAIIPGSGGLRTLRYGVAGRGKRGGTRVIYFWVGEDNQILMLYMYKQNTQEDLTKTQVKILRQVVEEHLHER